MKLNQKGICTSTPSSRIRALYGKEFVGKSADPPASPDYASIIPLQKQANLDVFNQMLNSSRANQITPYGSSSWTHTPGTATAGTPGTPGTPDSWSSDADGFHMTPGTPGSLGTPGTGGTSDQWTNNISLSPEQQQLYQQGVGSQLQMGGLLSGMAGQVGQATGKPLDFSALMGSLDPSHFQDATFANGLPGSRQFSQEGADAAYGQATRYLAPQQEAQQRQLESRLGEQGFVPGTPAYQQAMGEFQRNKDLSYADARDRATTQGFNVGNQWFQNDLSGRNLQREQTSDANSVADRLYSQNVNSRQRSLAEMLTKRQTPLNEMSALRSGTQVQNPNVSPTFSTPNLQGTDLLGAANQNYQNQMGAYNAQVGSDNSLMGMLGSLGGMALGGPFGGALGKKLFGG